MLIEQLLQKYIGDSPVLFYLIGLAILIIANLILSLMLAHKSKDDDINFELLPDFIKPLLLYGAFLVCGEAMIIATKGVSFVYEAAKGFQVLVFATIVLKYFKQAYAKLKALGMETDEVLDRKIEAIIPSQPKTIPIESTTIVPGRPEEDER